MILTNKILQLISAYICAICSFFLGDLNGLLKALIAFMIFDYLTGIWAAYKNKSLSSKIGAEGIAKKVYILMLVSMANLLDTQVFGGSAVCRNAIIGFYIANEGLSISENAVKIGVPVPKKFIDLLDQLKNKEDK